VPSDSGGDPGAAGPQPSGSGPDAAQRDPSPPRPGRPSRTQRPPRPSRPPGREVRQRAFAGLIFGMLSLLSLLGVGYNIHRGIYLVIFTLVIGPAGCWLAISAMRRSHRDGTLRPRGAVAGAIFGIIAVVLGLGMLALFTLAGKQVTQYSQCLDRAQTLSEQHVCTIEFQRSFGAGLGPIGAGLGH
jgi:hypothetical protein